MNSLSIVLTFTLVGCCLCSSYNTNQERGMKGQTNSGTGGGNYEEGNRRRESQSSNLGHGSNGLGNQGSQGNGYGSQGSQGSGYGTQGSQGNGYGTQGYSQSNQGHGQGHQGHGRDTERYNQGNQGQGQGHGSRQGQGGSQLNQHSSHDGYQTRGY